MDFLEGDRARLEPSGPSKRPPSPEEWYVTSQGDFWPSSRRERPGVQLPFRGEFDWAGFHWLVPGVYSTAKALVVDFCRQVEPEDVRAFVEKWRLTPENDREELFTKEERRRMAAENPLEFSFHPAAVVNGREYPYKRGSGSYYNCCVNWNSQEPEGKLLGKHYGLDPEKVWSLWRFAFPWGRRKRVRSLSLRLKADPLPLPGSVFQVRGPGDRVELAHPKTGEKSILTVKSLQAIHHRELPRIEDGSSPATCGSWSIPWSRSRRASPFRTRWTMTRCAKSTSQGTAWGWVPWQPLPPSIPMPPPSASSAGQTARCPSMCGRRRSPCATPPFPPFTSSRRNRSPGCLFSKSGPVRSSLSLWRRRSEGPLF